MFIKKNRHIIFILFLVVATLACQAISTVSEQVEETKATVVSVVTEVQEVVTEVQEVATQIQEVATESAPLLATVKAVATENPGLAQTAQAIVTQGFSFGEAPPDIPVVDQDQVQSYFGSKDFVSYITTLDYTTVLEFYKTEMPANGWEAVEAGSFEFENTAFLNYAKPNRNATVTLSVNPTDNTTIVAIAITPK